MKTVSGHCVSVKDVSLSKATKIFSKFVSADNGASHGINAYLHRASMSFDELNQLHKEFHSSRSHKKKHKSHITEAANDQSGRVVENSVHGHVKSNEFGRDWSASENVLRDEVNGSIGYPTENVGGSEKHKKKKKLEVYDDKPLTGVHNEIELGREQGNEGEVNHGMEEGKEQKSAKKKHKVNASSFPDKDVEGENGRGLEQQKDIEKKLCNGVEGENGGIGGSSDLKVKKKKKYEAGDENNLYAEEVKMERSKKRKSDDVEGILD
ncbi:uncharacterized protein LOC109795153 [Cajanus cajan]|uniref:Uncharacterized protein n=1 Tax=Cajanus cajan TaxID=3821 RepID=A0A151TYX3_CAJCA|nr:uncharacterized protein LOC109795153 [Cajanus cajan]XP_020210164.1 uncharacterized protein LOC109795153 [Cajanus cajan]XP_020210165.1 uncharacterized protein LOC109795153 [Cajanus cajan]KYP72247.1 hypothetical protein KK1_004835 [Cajanus cajan]